MVIVIVRGNSEGNKDGRVVAMSLRLGKHFDELAEILRIIHAGRVRTFEVVNIALIDTFRAVGEYLSTKGDEAGWGKGVVQELARWLAAQAPDLKSFSTSNLWRIKQFYEVYQQDELLAPLVRELPWNHNLLILSTTSRYNQPWPVAM